ncbi:MAG TPA: polysaccharide deacetylase family protein [Ktedonobacteraceae bacterium]
MESKRASCFLPAHVAVFLISVVTVNLCVRTAQPSATPPSAPTPVSDPAIAIAHGNRWLPQVALTFDDGPGQYTPQILAILRRYGVRATFFSIGENIARFPAYLHQGLADQNALENHTFTHPHLTTLPFASIYRELSATQSAVLKETGTSPTVFRPPYGEYNADVLRAASQLGLSVVTWDADAQDWISPQPSAAMIAARILNAASNGAIFLLHEGGGNRANTVAALPAIISGLLARGLALVTLPQMLAGLNPAGAQGR